MKKINFSLILTGDTLQDQLNLPDDAESLHVRVEYPVDGRFNIKSIMVTKNIDVQSKKGGCHCESFGPYLLERYVRSIKPLKDSLKGQHELVEHVKSSLLQSLEALNMLDVRDGDEIEFDEFAVVA